MRAFGIIVTILLVIGALWALGVIGRGCDTASQMADETVFNASKHVWSYEEFHRKYQAYLQFQEQQTQAEARLKELAGRGVTEGTEYQNLVMERDGSRQMMNRIAAEYNAMSDIAYQGVWKGRGLPEKLE